VWYWLRLGWTFGDRFHAALQKDPNWPHPDRSMNKINDSHRAFFRGIRRIDGEIHAKGRLPTVYELSFQ